MPMTLIVPDDVAAVAAEVADKRGVSAEELIVETLRIHLPPIPAELLEEFELWEKASDEDFVKFVREHETP